VAKPAFCQRATTEKFKEPRSYLKEPPTDHVECAGGEGKKEKVKVLGEGGARGKGGSQGGWVGQKKYKLSKMKTTVDNEKQQRHGHHCLRSAGKGVNIWTQKHGWEEGWFVQRAKEPPASWEGTS